MAKQLELTILLTFFLMFCCHGEEVTYQDDVDEVNQLLDKLLEQATSLEKRVNKLQQDFGRLSGSFSIEGHNIRKQIYDARNENWQLFEKVKKELNDKRNDKSIIEEGLASKAEEIAQPYEDQITELTDDYEKDRDKRLADIKNVYDDYVSKTNTFIKLNENLESLPTRAGESLRGNDKYKVLDNSIQLTIRQLRSQMFNVEEQQRSDGNSGIKQIGISGVVGDVYKINSYTGDSFASIHDHSNKSNVVGLGKLDAVLNGIEFQTRHNDYKLFKPKNYTDDYHAVEEIKMPDVPDDVKNAGTVAEKVNLVKKWFEKFKDAQANDVEIQKVFVPVLCYLEGAYVKPPKDGKINKLFESSHSMNATTYKSLFQKVLYTSFTGEQNKDWAYLPSVITDIKNSNIVSAQWTYRILCHEIKSEFKRKYLQLIQDSLSRINVPAGEKFEDSLQARFTLDGIDVYGNEKGERPVLYTKTDELMEEVPGKNNYGGFSEAEGFDSDIVSANPKKAKSNKKLNGGNYHRPYKLKQKDAMGVDNAQRSFCDRVYVATTFRENVQKVCFSDKKISNKCTRNSYAIPLEIIYLTPLQKWNPYGIKVETSKPQEHSGTESDPFEYVTEDSYYLTPCELFDGIPKEEKRWAKVGGKIVEVCASGIRALIPSIGGSGKIRQRYPIFPVSDEGSTIGKSIDAMEDILKKREPKPDVKLYATGVSGVPTQEVRKHTHVVDIPVKQYKELEDGKSITITTESSADHVHKVRLQMIEKKIHIKHCDDGKNDDADNKTFCHDKHPEELRTSKTIF